MSRKVPDALLERYLAGDLGAERQAAIEAELKTSPEDQARFDELRADSAAFLIKHPPGPLVARATEGRSKRRWWRAFMPALAAAAAAVLLFSFWQAAEPDRSVKGGVAFTAFLKVGQDTHRIARGDVLHEGNQVRFALQAPAAGFVAVLSKDGAGHVTVYHPFGESQAAPYLPDQALMPGAIALDATKGREQVWAVYSAQPFALGPLVESLEKSGELPKDDGRTVLELEWNKR